MASQRRGDRRRHGERGLPQAQARHRRFYADRILPQINAERRKIEAGADSLMTLPAAAF